MINSSRWFERRQALVTWMPLFIWHLEVVAVLVSCCLVIRACIAPSPPKYTLTNFHSPHHDLTNTTELTSNHSLISPQYTSNITFDLQIMNPNKAESIIYDPTKVTLRKSRTTILGAASLPALFQGGRENTSSNVVIKSEGRYDWSGCAGDGGGAMCAVTMMVSLETVVRYKILWWKTKRYKLGFEGFVLVGLNGEVLGDDKAVKLVRRT